MNVVKVLTRDDLVKAARKGITRDMVNSIIKATDMSLSEFGHYIHLTARAIQRKKPKDKLSPGPSERALLIANLYNKGAGVFESKEKFTEWMNTANISLGKVKPKDYLDTFSGLEHLSDELGRIEHGFNA